MKNILSSVFRPITLPLMVVSLYCFFISCTKKNNVVTPQFSSLFSKEQTITIDESDSLPLNGVYEPTIISDKIFLPSISTNNIYVCDKFGKLVNALNHNDTLKLRMPSHVTKFGDKYLINDKGNHFVKVLDINFNLIASIAIDGQVNQILIPNNAKESGKFVVFHGSQNSFGKVVLFKKYDDTLSISTAFGEVNPKTLLHTWKAYIDTMGLIYNINILGKSVDVFAGNGKKLKEIKLESTTLDSLLDTDGISNSNPMETIVSIKHKDYYSIKNLNLYKEYIFVQFQNSKNQDKLLLDVYRQDGVAVYSGIEMNEKILGIENGSLSTMSKTVEKEKTILKINRYKINL